MQSDTKAFSWRFDPEGHIGGGSNFAHFLYGAPSPSPSWRLFFAGSLSPPRLIPTLRGILSFFAAVCLALGNFPTFLTEEFTYVCVCVALSNHTDRVGGAIRSLGCTIVGTCLAISCALFALTISRSFPLGLLFVIFFWSLASCLALIKWPFTYTSYLCACMTFYFTLVRNDTLQDAIPATLCTAFAFCIGAALTTLSCIIIAPTASSGALYSRAAALTRTCGTLFTQIARAGTSKIVTSVEIEEIKASVTTARFELAMMTRLVDEEKFEFSFLSTHLSPSVFTSLQAMVSTLSSLSTTIRAQNASRHARFLSSPNTSFGTDQARPVNQQLRHLKAHTVGDTVFGDTMGGAELARVARELSRAANGAAAPAAGPHSADAALQGTQAQAQQRKFSLAQLAVAIGEGGDVHFEDDEPSPLESPDSRSDMTAEIEADAPNFDVSTSTFGSGILSEGNVSTLPGAATEHLNVLIVEAADAIADLAETFGNTSKNPPRRFRQAQPDPEAARQPPRLGRRYSTIPVHNMHRRNASVASMLSPMRDGFDVHQDVIVEHMFAASTRTDVDAANLMDVFFVFGFFEFLRQVRRLEFAVKVPAAERQPTGWQSVKRVLWKLVWTVQDWLPQGETSLYRWLMKKLWDSARFLDSYEYRFAIKVSLAVTLFSILAFVESTRDWFIEWKVRWAVITIFAIASPTHAGVLLSGFQRTLGTLIGASVAVASCLASSSVPYAFAALSIVSVTPLFIAKYKGDPDYMKAATVAELTFSVIAIPQVTNTAAGETILRVAYERVLMIALGSVIIVLVNRLIWPRLARVELRKSLGETIEGIGTLYSQLASIFMTRRRFTQAETERIERLEQRLQLQIIQERVLLFLTQREPRAQGTFPHKTFHELIRSLQFVVDLLRSTRVVLSQTHFNEELDESDMLLLDADRVEMFRAVLVLIWIIRAALRIKQPLPAYLPDCVSPRVRLNEKFLKLRTASPSNANAWATLAFYSYSFAMTLVIWRLEKIALLKVILVRSIKSLYGEIHGVEGLSSNETEQMRQLESEISTD
ncbi:hypothetical protein M427DRAFT_149942 [Gonapodya prolifera JEL478]|uniref:DUF2421 domain-containing protein n=1 Tax=Gonapodya prolifera (strain JEL478) TaxID=1344416 RepID=A0A138ZYE0_GONPJ|nr:hypothetical protein M427DRAFT_149942 [Gonapodya prolifera JEL478]|eukprot:KXS09285.1 hypothetical protein M427DRAFT_149942 [Gonapodya prolifera JEL478]